MSLVSNENYINVQGWMINELNLSGNSLLVYAIIYGFSQDGQSTFSGSLQYLADWCNATKQGIQKNLKELQDKGYIEKKEIFRNNQKYCEYSCIPYNKVVHPIQQSCMAIQQSCINNQEDIIEENQGNVSNNKLLDIDFFGDKEKKPKKQSLYEKCSDCINEYTNSPILNSLLHDYLTLRLQMKDKPLYGVNQWKGLLNKLSELCKEKNIPEDIVRYSIQRGYASFFMPNVSKSAVKSQPTETNVSCAKMTEEEQKAQAEFIEECKRKGLQYEF